VTGVAAADFLLTTDVSVQAATPVVVSGSGATYTVTVNGIHGSGNLRLDLIDNGTITSSGVPLGSPGGANGSFQGQTYIILQSFPSVASINRTTPVGPVTNASSVTYTVTFSEPVTGVDPADFQLALGPSVTGTITQVTPSSGAVYSVTVSGISGNGTLGLNLVDNGSIHDLAGNPLTQQNAQAAFQAQHPPPPFAGFHQMVEGDVNGDSIPDIVNTGFGTVGLMLGNGNGTFQGQQDFATGGTGYGNSALGDVNGDGKPDLVVSNPRSSTVSLLLGNGNGTFQAGQTFGTAYYPKALVLSDVNGDGKPDIVVLTNSGVSVLLGNGNGTFQASQIVGNGGGNPIVLADVNGDGKPDLVVPNLATVSVL
jgi:FG-GAP-like repeat